MPCDTAYNVNNRDVLAWHWMDNEQPRQGIIAGIRRRTIAKYKHAVKALKREQDT